MIFEKGIWYTCKQYRQKASTTAACAVRAGWHGSKPFGVFNFLLIKMRFHLAVPSGFRRNGKGMFCNYLFDKMLYNDALTPFFIRALLVSMFVCCSPPIFNVDSVISQRPVNISMPSGRFSDLWLCKMFNFFTKTPVAFPYNFCQNNGQSDV